MANEGYGVFGYAGINGRFMRGLQLAEDQTWATKIGMRIASNQEVETYRWLGMPPAMRQWVGGRQEKKIRDEVYTLRNEPYEGTLEIHKDDRRRDKYGQIMQRVNDFARKTALHWNVLLTALIETNGLCYDGQDFFDTDHVSGDSGSQNNEVTSSEVATLQVVDAENPTASELALIIMDLVQEMYGFVDDTGDPINQDASNFLVMVPVNMMASAQEALSQSFLSSGNSNALKNSTFNFEVVANARLTDADVIYVFRTDTDIKSFILQSEVDVSTDWFDDTFKNRRYLFGVEAVRSVGYGMWQGAIKGQLATAP